MNEYLERYEKHMAYLRRRVHDYRYNYVREKIQDAENALSSLDYTVEEKQRLVKLAEKEARWYVGLDVPTPTRRNDVAKN